MGVLFPTEMPCTPSQKRLADMARSRNIKPSFFLNDELAAIGPEAQLLFAGLWCLADRAGRLKDRPLRIKAELFPYYEVDVDCLLDQLGDDGFLIRYKADDCEYIQIVNFEKHQSPHCKEPESSIPAPGEYGASTVQAPDESLCSTEVAALIPDCGYLIPEEELTSGSAEPDPAPKKKPSIPPAPWEAIVDAYHEILPELPKVIPARWAGSKRESYLKTRWKELPPDQRNVGWWRTYFQVVRTNPWWLGENDRQWKANLEWLLKRENFDKVLERWQSLAEEAA